MSLIEFITRNFGGRGEHDTINLIRVTEAHRAGRFKRRDEPTLRRFRSTQFSNCAGELKETPSSGTTLKDDARDVLFGPDVHHVVL